MTAGVTLVLSPGYFTKRNFTRQLMCLWNISCQDETQILFVNYTGDDHLANQSTGIYLSCMALLETVWVCVQRILPVMESMLLLNGREDKR